MKGKVREMKIVTAPNGVTYLASDLLGVPHGFSTRLGGVSTLPHTASLNLAFGHGDPEADVLENLSRFCAGIGADPAGVVSVPQIHSALVFPVGQEARGMGYSAPAAFSGDGYVTTERGVVPAVKTADCVPILFSAKDALGVPFAVAAVHAGWRGTSARIAAAAVRELIARGAVPERIFAAVGPSISACCYEVGEDFFAAFDPELRALFLRRDPTRPGKYFADLKGANAYVLRSCGIPEENIDVCALCTACRPDLFYSHRAQHGVRGSMLSAVTLGS